MLSLKNIVKNYSAGGSTVRALDGISLNFRDSEFVIFVGPSGCGKTTLLNIIGGLDQYTSGDLVINGVSTKKFKDAHWDTYRNHSIGFVFQNFNLLPRETALENVALPLLYGGVGRRERTERARQALEDVGLGDRLTFFPTQLSGGQKQRVAIARAFLKNAPIVILDEATSALDNKSEEIVQRAIDNLMKDKTVFVIAHRLSTVKNADRIAVINEGDYVENLGYVGKTIEGKPVIIIFDHALCTSGLELEGKNKEASVLKVVMDAYAENAGDLDTLPVKIYYPQSAVA